RQYQEAIEAFNRNVDTIFSDANSQLESLLNTKTKMNAENVENLIKLLKEDLEKRVSETKTDIRSKENRLHTELTSVTETSKRKMNEIQDKLNMEVATTFNKAGSDLESNQKHILNVLNRAKTDIDTRFQEARNASLASIDQEFKEQEDIFADTGSKLVDEIRLLTSTWENKTVNLLKETKDRAQSAISNIEMPAKSLLNEGKQTAVTQIKEEEKHTEKTIEQAKSGLEDTIIAQTSNVQQQFKGFGSKFKEGNKMIEKILANFELTYRELITKIKDMPRHTMNTMSVVGKDAVLAQMKEIFNRVKSTVTLVYPKVQDIPEDLLLNSNPRTRIIVISDFDQFKNASLIKSLMSKDNIQLKSLDIDATAPYYAIGRDHKEEGLIATLDVSGEVVGITSNSPQFVELISTEIINGVITPKTKRVTLPESEQL
ncbi:MAG: hypothetical protein U9O98_04340, partial [Asgard group archaeon]|nr:hypothetical protein [Asgard group archaeon]